MEGFFKYRLRELAVESPPGVFASAFCLL